MQRAFCNQGTGQQACSADVGLPCPDKHEALFNKRRHILQPHTAQNGCDYGRCCALDVIIEGWHPLRSPDRMFKD